MLGVGLAPIAYRGIKMTTVKKHQSIAIAILASVTAAALFFAAWVSAVGVPSAGAVSKGTTACFNTSKGTVFLRTVCKAGERKVVLGLPGATGAVGPSAFDLAQVGGFSGTVAEWLGSLVGIAGLVGISGANGFAGTAGVAGPAGLTGPTGVQGLIGLPGAAGAVGSAGLAGAKGDTGSPGSSGLTPAYGSFYDTTTQTNKAWVSAEASVVPYLPSTVNSFTFGNSSTQGAGVTVTGSKIIFAKAGTYNIQFSAQLFTTIKNTSEQIDIWLATNGKNEPFSDTQVLVPATGGKVGKAVAAWNFIVTVSKDDFCELRWVSDEQYMSIAAVPAEQTPAKVAIPSIILSVVQVG